MISARLIGTLRRAQDRLRSVGRAMASLLNHRDVAQLVERLVWDQEAASSSPAVPTITTFIKIAIVIA
jgi:hypothetical protein